MSITADLVNEVRTEFLSHSRDLLALLKAGPEDAMRRLTASLQLNADAQANVMLHANPEKLELKLLGSDHERAMSLVAQANFKRALYKETTVAFLKVLRSGAIEFVSRLTPEAEQQFEDIEISAGERQPRPVVPPPPPPKSAQEILIEQIKDDWLHLPTAKIRQKCNTDRQYRAEFDRLVATDELKSAVTSYTDGSGEFRQP